MLEFYAESTIIYIIIYWILNRIIKFSIENRTDVNYKDYKSNIRDTKRSKGLYYTYCFIPILRFLVIICILLICYGSKETLDTIFERKDREE